MGKILVLIGLMLVSYCSYSDELNDQMILNNQATFNASSIWQRLRFGFVLEHKQTKLVQYYEKFYTKNPSSFNRMMQRSLPYMYYILTQSERLGVPSELALIPAVETSFNNNVNSGLWQFEPRTATRFGLKVIPNQLDQRKNIVLATNMALLYFVYLHHLFGNWQVAIGAYNWGEGNMYNAIRNSGQDIGGGVNYNHLDLRTITTNYVPKLIALASIISNPQQFNVVLPVMPNNPYFKLVHPVYAMSVAEFIDRSNLASDDFFELNPQFQSLFYILSPHDRILVHTSYTNLQLNGQSPSTQAVATDTDNNDSILAQALLSGGDDTQSNDSEIESQNNDTLGEFLNNLISSKKQTHSTVLIVKHLLPEKKEIVHPVIYVKQSIHSSHWSIVKSKPKALRSIAKHKTKRAIKLIEEETKQHRSKHMRAKAHKRYD